MALHGRPSPHDTPSAGRPDLRPAVCGEPCSQDGACGNVEMTDSYGSDSDEDCELSDGFTLPAPWNPASIAQRRNAGHSEESRGRSGLTLPPPWASAAASAPRRSGTPPWSSNEGLQQRDEALLAIAAAAMAAAETEASRGHMEARAASTGTLMALVSSQHSPTAGDSSIPGSGLPRNKSGGWLSTLTAQHSPELLRGSGKCGSAPDFGDVQMRIRAHRPSAAGARPPFSSSSVVGQGPACPTLCKVSRSV